MKTLWSFGGSYSIFVDSLNNTWQHQIIDKLNLELKSFGLGGASQDYTSMKFNEVRHLIKPDDVIVITIPDLDRRWFIRDEPEKANWNFFSRGEELHKSVKHYLLYLDNSSVYRTYFMNFLYNLHSLNNVKIILLPCFKDVDDILQEVKYQFPKFDIASGYLDHIHLNEFTKEFMNNYGYLNYGRLDIRINHLTTSNHTILANKIVDNVLNDTPVDLLTGFVKEVLDRKTLTSIEFSEKELFNAHLNYNAWTFHKF